MPVEIFANRYMLGDEPIAIELTADQRGLTACRLLHEPVPVSTVITNEHLQRAAHSIEQYFATADTDLDARLAPDGTPFQRAVWRATGDIPYGQVRSYKWVATRIGNPRAVRAVAQALSANPLLLFVPCHRVVQHDGGLGGFGCGIHWKIRLLEKEGIPGSDQKNLRQFFQESAQPAML